MNNKGTAHLGLIIIIVILIAAAGYFLLTKDSGNDSEPTATPATSGESKTTPTTTKDSDNSLVFYEHDLLGINFEYPSQWGDVVVIISDEAGANEYDADIEGKAITFTFSNYRQVHMTAASEGYWSYGYVGFNGGQQSQPQCSNPDTIEEIYGYAFGNYGLGYCEEGDLYRYVAVGPMPEGASTAAIHGAVGSLTHPDYAGFTLSHRLPRDWVGGVHTPSDEIKRDYIESLLNRTANQSVLDELDLVDAFIDNIGFTK